MVAAQGLDGWWVHSGPRHNYCRHRPNDGTADHDQRSCPELHNVRVACTACACVRSCVQRHRDKGAHRLGSVGSLGSDSELSAVGGTADRPSAGTAASSLRTAPAAGSASVAIQRAGTHLSLQVGPHNPALAHAGHRGELPSRGTSPAASVVMSSVNASGVDAAPGWVVTRCAAAVVAGADVRASCAACATCRTLAAEASRSLSSAGSSCRSCATA